MSAAARRAGAGDVPATLILGCGYGGLRIAAALAADGEVVGTRRGPDGLAELEAAGVRGLRFEAGAGAGAQDDPGDALRGVLSRTTHLVSSVAPARAPPLDDPTLDAVAGWLGHGLLPRLEWIGYLSTIGVYGDRGGARVDEDSPCASAQPRSIARREAELGWTALGARAGTPVAVLRLSGIYGPGRNAVRDALAGRARMLVRPGQVFNRVHVEDLARATALAARARFDGVLNVTDDEPAAPEDVIRHAHALVGRAPPPAMDFETADLSPMARSFWAETKRVDNARSKRALGLDYRYPDYRAGLASLVAGELAAAARAAP